MLKDAVRTHVVIPRELLDAVDREVGLRQRSQFVAEALREKLARLDLLRAAERAAGSLADAEIPGWETAESTDAWVRTVRQSSDRVGQHSHDE